VALLQKWDAEIKSGEVMPLEAFLAQQEAACKPK
jgi:hypothetical protein